ncbi:hypothetical protein GQX74_014657 [Glossina fuscipes]|nr:hypothetical protein GQX74_014657 [Glossina fuscipes]
MSIGHKTKFSKKRLSHGFHDATTELWENTRINKASKLYHSSQSRTLPAVQVLMISLGIVALHSAKNLSCTTMSSKYATVFGISRNILSKGGLSDTCLDVLKSFEFQMKIHQLGRVNHFCKNQGGGNISIATALTQFLQCCCHCLKIQYQVKVLLQNLPLIVLHPSILIGICIVLQTYSSVDLNNMSTASTVCRIVGLFLVLMSPTLLPY